jgi:hypothetical protein
MHGTDDGLPERRVGWASAHADYPATRTMGTAWAEAHPTMLRGGGVLADGVAGDVEDAAAGAVVGVGGQAVGGR